MEYICLCNGITDEQARRAVCCGARRPKEVYESAGHRAQCGKCTRDILALIRSTPPPWPNCAPDSVCGEGPWRPSRRA